MIRNDVINSERGTTNFIKRLKAKIITFYRACKEELLESKCHETLKNNQ